MRAALALVAAVAAGAAAMALAQGEPAPARIALEPLPGRMVIIATVPGLGGEQFNLVLPKTISCREMELVNDAPGFAIHWDEPEADGTLRGGWDGAAAGSYALVLRPAHDHLDVQLTVTNRTRVTWTDTWAFTFMAPRDPASSFVDPTRERILVPHGGGVASLARLDAPDGPRPEITFFLREGAGNPADQPFIHAMGQTSADRVDGDWMLLLNQAEDAWVAWSVPEAMFMFNHRGLSSIHVAPLLGDLAPGESATVELRAYFARGGREEALARIAADRRR